MNKTLRYNSSGGPSKKWDLSSSEKIIRSEPTQVKESNNSTDSHVYIKSKDHEWVPAVLVETDGKKQAIVQVQKYNSEDEMLSGTSSKAGFSKKKEVTINLNDYENRVLPLQNVNDSGRLLDCEDMVNLPYLHEAAILYNLKNRHAKEKPYTRTGDIVVAMNPYKWYPDLYTEKKRSMYARRLVWERSENDPRATVEPHVYEVSALSYKGLAIENENQSILVSGESGAGKTETVKICMNHVAIIQHGPAGCIQDQEKGAGKIIKRVVDSNPLLEAFGNAKTRRNDNSSRFGKFLQLQFDKSNSVATLAGSKCDVYLLEKNRVNVHDEEERTYHIFYQLLAANESDKKDIWKGLCRTNNDSFTYVGHTTTDTIEGICDGERFGLTRDTLALVGVKGEKFRTLMQAMCIVLQLGNIAYGSNNGDDDKSAIISRKELADLSDLMGIADADLTKALTERTVKTRSEEYSVPLNPETAKDSTDAFSREIYGRLFLWIVRAINVATCAEENYNGGNTKEFGTIGLLDIFGFESFDVNRFEQLCINYANEKLQHKFTEDIFCSVQEEYEYEGIPLAEITYDDNTPVVDLIEARGGLLSILNDECLRPKGNDAAFVAKAMSQLKKNKCLIPNRTDRLSFGVHHFAGKVMYSATDFVTRNQDTLPSDLSRCGTKCSKNSIIMSLFQAVPEKKDERRRTKSCIAGDTVWTKYKYQLSQLMNNIRKTQTRYIRCIKSNSIKKPLVVEHKITVEQLRTAGIVAGITISRSAFPNRLYNTVTYSRYNGMWDKKNYPSKGTRNDSTSEKLKEDCIAMLSGLLKHMEIDGKKQFAVGKTRTYFRSGALEYLESNRQKGLDTQALTVQRVVRGWLVRKTNDDLLKKKKRDLLKKKQAEQERRERLAKESKGRELKREKTLKVYKKQIDQIEKKIDEFEGEMTESLSSLKTQLVTVKQEQKDYEKKLKGLDKDVEKGKELLNEKLERVAGNKLLISKLKQDNKRLSKVHEKVQKKHKRLSVNNDTLEDTTKKGSSMFNETFPGASNVFDKYDDLKDEEEIVTKKNKKLNEEVASWQDDYWKKASARLEVQKSLGKILSLIQNNSKNQKLIEKTHTIGLKCEKQSNKIMKKVDAEFASSNTKVVDASSFKS